jgi:hypothetical protein
MSERISRRKSLFAPQLKHSRVGLDNFKVKGDNLIEKSLMGTEPYPLFGRVIQILLDGSGCLRHIYMPFCAAHVPLNGLFTYLFFFIEQNQ